MKRNAGWPGQRAAVPGWPSKELQVDGVTGPAADLDTFHTADGQTVIDDDDEGDVL